MERARSIGEFGLPLHPPRNARIQLAADQTADNLEARAKHLFDGGEKANAFSGVYTLLRLTGQDARGEIVIRRPLNETKVGDHVSLARVGIRNGPNCRGATDVVGLVRSALEGRF